MVYLRSLPLFFLLFSLLFLLSPPAQGASFYQANKKELRGEKGKLIRSKAAPANVRLSEARRARTVLYTSRTPKGKAIAASGTVLLPKGRAPRGGWPVLLFHHGTTGVADICAPSKGSSLLDSYSDVSLLYSSWLRSGYAVALPDYAGLGTKGPHPYLIGNSQARSSLDILPAAKKLFPSLSRRYSILGHSQGGQAAIFSARLAPDYLKGFRNVGTISYAPPSSLDLQAKFLSALGSAPSSLTALATLIVRSAGQEANVNPEPVLTPRLFSQNDPQLSSNGNSFWQLTEKVCLPQLAAKTAAEGGLAPDAFLTSSDWISDSTLLKLDAVLQKMDPSLAFKGSLDLLQGADDTTVLPSFTNALAGRLDALNPGRLQYKVYPEATHSSILEASGSDVLSRLAELFANQK